MTYIKKLKLYENVALFWSEAQIIWIYFTIYPQKSQVTIIKKKTTINHRDNYILNTPRKTYVRGKTETGAKYYFNSLFWKNILSLTYLYMKNSLCGRPMRFQ